MSYVILNTAEDHAALEAHLRTTRPWFDEDRITREYDQPGRPDKHGNYPLVVIDQAAESAIREYDKGKYADAELVELVEWPEEPEQ